MVADFHNLPLLQNHNPIGVGNRAQAMSDHHGGAVFHELCQAVLDLQLAVGIKIAGGFVEYQDLRVGQNCAGDRQSLLLSGGAEPNSHQVEMLLTNALEACESYFQAFQFVNWSGLNAREALDAVLFETEGTC